MAESYRSTERRANALDRGLVLCEPQTRRQRSDAMDTPIGDIRGVLLDLDGTVYDDRGLIDGADRAVARLRTAGLALRFATNTSRHPRGALVEWLQARP